MAMTKKRWSINALSVELGLDRRTLARRLEDVEPAESKEVGDRTVKTFWLADVFLALSSPGSESEMERLARVRADNVEFDLEVKKGTFVHLSRVENSLADWAHQLKSYFETIPKKYALAIRRSGPAIFVKLR